MFNPPIKPQTSSNFTELVSLYLLRYGLVFHLVRLIIDLGARVSEKAVFLGPAATVGGERYLLRIGIDMPVEGFLMKNMFEGRGKPKLC